MSGALDRRRFLAALPGLAAVGCGLGGRRMRALDAVGLQLYTVREAIGRDLDGVLAALAEIGYREVELAGLYGLTAREMRARLDAVGLRAVSSHHSLAELRGDWPRVLADARTLGQSLVVVPSIPGSERDGEALRRIADDFDRAGERARDAGLRFGYHNHDWELARLPDGTRPMDLLLDRTDADVVDWQMDVFWTVHGGADPVRYLREHAGRVTSVHVKDRTPDGRMVDVGDGVIDWAALLPLAQGLGLRHAFVEHDTPDDPIRSARRSLTHLRSLGMGGP